MNRPSTQHTLDLCDRIIARIEAKTRFDALVEAARLDAEYEVAQRRAAFARALEVRS
jgi:hypothetical protein